MTFIYTSTALEKMDGPEWLYGTAMYYIYRLEEFVRFPIPAFLYNEPVAFSILTWLTVLVEALIPILVWIKETRWVGIGLAVALHLGIEYQMNLNFFQWVMLCGICSFIPLKPSHKV